jgi:hypothetical protein
MTNGFQDFQSLIWVPHPKTIYFSELARYSGFFLRILVVRYSESLYHVDNACMRVDLWAMSAWTLTARGDCGHWALTVHEQSQYVVNGKLADQTQPLRRLRPAQMNTTK